MVVYDTEDESQAEELTVRVGSDDLYRKNLLQAFAPDELAEARNRGFKPAR